MATHLSRSVSAAPLSRSESAELFPIPHPSRAHTSVCLSCELNFLLSLSTLMPFSLAVLRLLREFSKKEKQKKKEKSYTTSDVAEEEKLQLNVIVAQRGAPANKLTLSLPLCFEFSFFTDRPYRRGGAQLKQERKKNCWAAQVLKPLDNFLLRIYNTHSLAHVGELLFYVLRLLFLVFFMNKRGWRFVEVHVHVPVRSRCCASNRLLSLSFAAALYLCVSVCAAIIDPLPLYSMLCPRREKSHKLSLPYLSYSFIHSAAWPGMRATENCSMKFMKCLHILLNLAINLFTWNFLTMLERTPRKSSIRVDDCRKIFPHFLIHLLARVRARESATLNNFFSENVKNTRKYFIFHLPNFFRVRAALLTKKKNARFLSVVFHMRLWSPLTFIKCSDVLRRTAVHHIDMITHSTHIDDDEANESNWKTNKCLEARTKIVVRHVLKVNVC